MLGKKNPTQDTETQVWYNSTLSCYFVRLLQSVQCPPVPMTWVMAGRQLDTLMPSYPIWGHSSPDSKCSLWKKKEGSSASAFHIAPPEVITLKKVSTQWIVNTLHCTSFNVTFVEHAAAAAWFMEFSRSGNSGPLLVRKYDWYRCRHRSFTA